MTVLTQNLYYSVSGTHSLSWCFQELRIKFQGSSFDTLKYFFEEVIYIIITQI